MINKVKNFLVVKSKIKSILFFKYSIFILVLSGIIYLSVPKLLNYEKKINFLQTGLNHSYGIEVEKLNSISYNIFPSPRLIIKNSKIIFPEIDLRGTAKNLIIILDISKIYNLENLKIKNINIVSSKFFLKKENLKKTINQINQIENKISLNDAKLFIKEKDKIILEFENFNLKKKNNLEINTLISGYKTYLTFLNKLNKKLTLKIPKLGIDTNIIFDDRARLENLSGQVEANILNNKFKFYFESDEKIKISNSFFRNKFLQTSFDGNITTEPFFYFDLNLNLKNVNFNKFNDKDLISKIFDLSKNRKKFNGKINLVYKKEKFKKSSINNMLVKLSSKNGQIKLNNSVVEFPWGSFNLNGDFSEYEGYQKFNFIAKIDVFDHKKFIKIFNVDKKNHIKPMNLFVDGYLNISSNKIYFNKIQKNKDQIFSSEANSNYKILFEKLIIGNNIINIFDFKRFTNFFNEIY
ncbi:MAG: hypothetical protein ACJZ69_01595 [Pelagibacteraceae bacterium]